MMKRLMLLLALALLGTPLSFAQNGHALFQQALQQERAEGNLEAAIALYARIVEEHASDRALAAKVLFRMGQNYERLGQAEKARRAFERVLSEYADQAEVPLARERLTARVAPVQEASIDREPSGLITRRIVADLPGSPATSASPDGALLAYPNWNTGDLTLEDLASSAVRSLTGNQAPYYPGMAIASVFSPDGQQIAYNWGDFSTGSEVWDLRIINTDGSGARVLFSSNEATAIVTPMDWSPDGTHILATRMRHDVTNQIVLIAAADGSVQVLKSLDWNAPLAMRFSPDGRFVVYDRPQEEGSLARDVYLLAVDGSRETALIEHPANDYVAGWTPDGHHLLFMSDRAGAPGAWLLPVEDGEPQEPPILAKSDLWGITPIEITHEGALLYDVMAASPAIYLADVDAETGVVRNERRLTRPDVAIPNALDWSPDGQHLAYSVRRGPFAGGGLAPQYVMIHPLATGNVRQLNIQPPLRYFYAFQWSPDNRTLFLTAQDLKGRQHVYRVDSETGHAQPLFRVDEDVTLWGLHRSPDGSEAYFRQYREHQLSSIVARSLASGAQRILYQVPYAQASLSPPTLSPDGQRLAFLFRDPKERAHRIMTVPAQGGEVREVARFDEDEGILYRMTWTPTSEALWYLRKTDGEAPQHQVWRISVDEEEAPRPLALKGEGLHALQFRHDGQRIAYIAGEEKHELWVMEGFLPAGKKAK